MTDQRPNIYHFLPVLTLGFSTAAVTWVVAFVTHAPLFGLYASHEAIPALLTLAGWFISTVVMYRLWLPADRWFAIGAASGALSAAITTLILLSTLSQARDPSSPSAGAEGVVPATPLWIAGFLVLGAVIGAIGAVLARTGQTSPTPSAAPDWLRRFAITTALVTLPLIVVGGLVTSTRAGMSIIGWPDSFGANMFLYPLSLMLTDPAMYLEHTHRLFGTFVGLCAIAMIMLAALTDRRVRSVKTACAFSLLVFVSVQGLLGGLRVTEESVAFAIFHGVLGQLVFASFAAYAAYVATPLHRDRGSPDFPNRGKAFKVTLVLIPALLIHLVFGALYRHLKHEPDANPSHALWSHVVFSLVILNLAAIAGFIARAPEPAPAPTKIRQLGGWIIGVLGLQFVLGAAALLIVLTREHPAVAVGEEVMTDPETPWYQALIATSHQANGALLLALSAVMLVWTRKPRPPST